MRPLHIVPIICFLLSIGCKVTEKTVDQSSSGSNITAGSDSTGSDTSGGGGGGTAVGKDAKVTSHFNGQQVDAADVFIEGQCDSSLGNVIVEGNINASPVTMSCQANTFSGIVKLTEFNALNSLTVSQGAGASFVQSNIDLSLFARAAFCGDNVVNQDFEVCDGDVGCDEFCQNASSANDDLVLARVRVSNVVNIGNGEATNNVFLGSGQFSIPSNVWFPVFFNGSFFFDQQTTFFSDAPGILVRRIGSEIKLMLSTGLSSSDLEHIDGRLEFQNAIAKDIRNGIGAEAAENESDGIGEFDPDQDEIFIESGISHFWFSEDEGDDAYFTEWE